MAAPKQILDEIDDTKGTLMDTMYDVQTTMAKLHSTVGDLLDSMAEMLKSMSEMKEAALQQPTTESPQITLIQNLPESPVKPQSIPVDDSIDEEKKESSSESRYTYLKKIQIEMPIFEGSNVNQWIAKAERYFEIGDFTEIEKMKLVYLSVDGAALNWYNFWKIRQPFVDWDDFKSRLLGRFGDFEFGSAFERLLTLQQEDSVVHYLGQFEEFASQLSEDTRGLAETLFVKGLKEEIKDVLPLFRHRAKGIEDVIDMARRLENGPFCSMVKKYHQSLECSSPPDE